MWIDSAGRVDAADGPPATVPLLAGRIAQPCSACTLVEGAVVLVMWVMSIVQKRAEGVVNTVRSLAPSVEGVKTDRAAGPAVPCSTTPRLSR